MNNERRIVFRNNANKYVTNGNKDDVDDETFVELLNEKLNFPFIRILNSESVESILKRNSFVVARKYRTSGGYRKTGLDK